MPHVCFVPMSGFRVREAEMGALGMALPGLRERAAAIAALPSLGVLTLAGMTPPHWEVSLHEAPNITDAFIKEIASLRPTLVAVSALTASAFEAYQLADAFRAMGILTVLGGLHATTEPDDALKHFDSVVIGDGEPVWHDLLSDAESGRLNARYSASRPFDLADAPLPRFELLNRSRRQRYTVQSLAARKRRGEPMLGHFARYPNALSTSSTNRSATDSPASTRR